MKKKNTFLVHLQELLINLFNETVSVLLLTVTELSESAFNIFLRRKQKNRNTTK